MVMGSIYSTIDSGLDFLIYFRENGSAGVQRKYAYNMSCL